MSMYLFTCLFISKKYIYYEIAIDNVLISIRLKNIERFLSFTLINFKGVILLDLVEV